MTASNRLATDYEELTVALENVPKIRLQETEGDPPERYDIEYRVKGFSRSAQGLITISLRHCVRITLPFGYPHFPPVCKPLTPIFHPDVDPDAIRIADFWEKKQSLVELVFLIGELICGQVIHDEQPFNDEAAMWFKKQAAILPLDNLRAPLEAEPAAEPFTVPEIGPADVASDEHDISALGGDDEEDNDEDLDDLMGEGLNFGGEEIDGAANRVNVEMDEFAGLSLDRKEEAPLPLIPAEKKPEVPPAVEPAVVQEIRDKITSREVFAARRLLNNVNRRAVFPERKEFEGSIREIISKAEEIYAQAKEHEEQDENDEAVKLLKQVAVQARDYPGIQEDIRRMSDSMHLMATLDGALKQKTSAAAGPGAPEGDAAEAEGAGGKKPLRAMRPQATGKKEKAGKQAAAVPGSTLTPLKMPVGPKRMAMLGVALVVVVALITVGIVLMMDYRNSMNAEEAWKKGSQYNEEKRFADANEQFNIAGEVSARIRLIKLGEKSRMREQISGLVGSLAFQEGLKGNVFYRNAYFPKMVVTRLKPVLDTADSDFAAKKNSEALAGYERALEVLKENKLNPMAMKREIKARVDELRLLITLEKAALAEEEKDWELASNLLRDAIRIGRENPATIDVDKLLERLALSSLRDQFRRGTEAFEQRNWAATVQYLSAVRNSLGDQGTGAAESPEFAALNIMLVLAGYNTLMEQAQAASGAGDPAGIINGYTALLALFDKERANLPEKVLADEHGYKKIILDTRIAQDRDTAVQARKDGDYARAIRGFEAVIATIDASDIGADSAYQRIRAEMAAGIWAAKKDKDVGSRIAYLEKNFQQIIKQYYPTVKVEDLYNPRVTLISEKDGIMLFNLTCVERDIGRRFRLELNYRYNSSTGQWILQNK